MQKMHLRIIAEGVETQHQADYLRLNECDFLQGYYFCRPVQADELVRIVNQGANNHPEHGVAAVTLFFLVDIGRTS